MTLHCVALSDTEFPYDASSSQKGGFGQGRPRGNGERPTDFPDDFTPDGTIELKDGFDREEGGRPNGGPEDIEVNFPQDGGEVDFTTIDNIQRNNNTNGVTLSGTYNSAQEYIDALNENGD